MVPLDEARTTAAVQKYLGELGRVDGKTESHFVVRALLARAVGRLQLLCISLLYNGYPRLTRPPLNLQPEDLLSAVVERLLVALEKVRPTHVRQFFALANKHMRWELNDLARRLDSRMPCGRCAFLCRVFDDIDRSRVCLGSGPFPKTRGRASKAGGRKRRSGMNHRGFVQPTMLPNNNFVRSS